MTIKRILYYLFISTISLVLLIVVFGLIYMIFDLVFDLSEVNFSGLVAFLGSIIGGGLTLIGVLITVNAHNKARKKEDLPKKLNHLENAIRILEDFIEKENLFDSGDPYNRKTNFIKLSSKYELYFTDNVTKYAVQKIQELKDEIIFIDAEAYKMFLRFKDQVNKLEYSLIELQDKLYEYKESAAFVSDDIEANLKLLEDLLPDETVNQLREINKLLHKKDREYKYYLEQYYSDLHCQLILKHEQFIKEMDY